MSALRDVVADLIELRGGMAERIGPDGLEVLAPPDVRAALGWPELARLGFGAEAPPSSMRVGIEGDWLERFGRLLGDQGRFAERQLLAADAAAADPERLLGQALDLPNAVWRFQGQAPAWTRCLLLAFRATAVSDEKRVSLIWLGFNAGTGAALGEVLPRLRAALADDQAWAPVEPAVRAAAGGGWDAATIERRVRPALEGAARAELAPFLAAMRRRLARDHGRLHAYHDDLRRQSQLRLAGLEAAAGPRAEADRERERQRIAAIEREYRAKLEDLRHNYALRVTVDWIQTLELFVPTRRLTALVRRRKGERTVTLDWHPLARLAEPPPCDWGLGTGRTRLVCDERLHLTEPAGQDPCPGCAKAFCRACHPAACPRCGERAGVVGG